MGDGRWTVGDVNWAMGDGRWAMGDGRWALGDARALRDSLVAKGWVIDHDLKYLEAEGGQHNEQSWGARVADVLKFLYPPM